MDAADRDPRFAALIADPPPQGAAPLIDSHCHLDFRASEADAAVQVERARAAGLVGMITVESGSDLEANARTVALAQAYDDVWACVGVHPHDAERATPALIDAIARLSEQPKVVALGEAGLDYHYDHSPREDQRAAFARWIAVARERALPLVIHTRSAEEDTLAVLDAEPLGPGGAVIHCFTGTASFARACLDRGLYLSIPGVVTFRNAGDVAVAAAAAPLDRLLVETDSPFLAPIPLRGRRNEPANVVHVAAKVAELRGMPVPDLAAATVANTRRFFRLA